MMTRFLTAIILPTLLLGGCNRQDDSDAEKEEKTNPPKTADPKGWKPKPGSEAKMTFYVKGMSDKLKLT